MADKKDKKAIPKSNEEIVMGFNQLRQEQRNLVNKVSELEVDTTEHRLVIDTLKDVDGDRKCYRLVGGILVERTVNEVLPALESNKDKISSVIDILNKQVESKGKDITDYREKYNIKIRGMDEKGGEAKPEERPAIEQQGQGVLVEGK